MSRWLNRFQPWGFFLLRVVLGISMLYHGWTKVVLHSDGVHSAFTFAALDNFRRFARTFGVPAWVGYISAYTELAGGALLILGLLTRLAASLVAVTMLVAMVTVGLSHSYLAAMAIMLVFAGPGRAALDRKIGLS